VSVIAIAGAGGGLGPVVVERLKGDGARIAVAERERSRAEGLGADHVTEVDLLDEGAARAWADGVAAELGSVDAVAHLVGGWRGGTPIGEADLADWDFLEPLLIRTTQHVSRAFLPHLKASAGAWALVSSAEAVAPTSSNASYAAAKAASEAWTWALADELKESGARANVVAVRAILTPAMREQNPEKPYRTFTSAADIAAALSWLFSEAGAKMNGQRVALYT
jgi:NAD(P)-dependent dehydrogenase (short-subunit alcohol dehydrogenase family)